MELENIIIPITIYTQLFLNSRIKLEKEFHSKRILTNLMCVSATMTQNGTSLMMKYESRFKSRDCDKILSDNYTATIEGNHTCNGKFNKLFLTFNLVFRLGCNNLL